MGGGNVVPLLLFLCPTACQDESVPETRRSAFIITEPFTPGGVNLALDDADARHVLLLRLRAQGGHGACSLLADSRDTAVEGGLGGGDLVATVHLAPPFDRASSVLAGPEPA